SARPRSLAGGRSGRRAAGERQARGAGDRGWRPGRPRGAGAAGRGRLARGRGPRGRGARLRAGRRRGGAVPAGGAARLAGGRREARRARGAGAGLGRRRGGRGGQRGGERGRARPGRAGGVGAAWSPARGGRRAAAARTRGGAAGRRPAGRWTRERDAALLLAAAVGEGSTVLDARAAFARPGAVPVARALEAVEVNLPAALRPLVMPWLEAAPPEPAGGPPDEGALAARLRGLAAGQEGTYLGPWVRACVLHLIGAARLTAAADVADAAASEVDPLVAHTARWAAQRLGATGGEEAGMLSTLERVIILKGVRFFSGAPDEVLADVAALLDEVEVPAGADVVRQGEVGDSLYVVAEGEVSVRDGPRELEVLGEGEAFGEMALLDPGPRSATVTAAVPSRLLRLSRGPFLDLVYERPEVAVGIMEVL